MDSPVVVVTFSTTTATGADSSRSRVVAREPGHDR